MYHETNLAEALRNHLQESLPEFDDLLFGHNPYCVNIVSQDELLLITIYIRHTRSDALVAYFNRTTFDLENPASLESIAEAVKAVCRGYRYRRSTEPANVARQPVYF